MNELTRFWAGVLLLFLDLKKMNTGGRLIAGSHNRNEFVLINADENARVSNPFARFADFWSGLVVFFFIISNLYLVISLSDFFLKLG